MNIHHYHDNALTRAPQLQLGIVLVGRYQEVGKIFLELLDTHFPPGHRLRSVMNRNTVKLSYRCLPNMCRYMAKHNSKILRKADGHQEIAPPKCNCQKSKKNDCPVPGACNQKDVIYQATVTFLPFLDSKRSRA